MYTIDGITWPYPCTIEREAEIKPSDISGLMLDRNYFNDVYGTYMQYTVAVAVPTNDRDIYNQVYELLTDPVDGHEFVFPYNAGTLKVTARVQSVPDRFVRLWNDGKYWQGLRFTVAANHPTKAHTLGEAISRGRAPIPEIAQPNEGDTYTWTEGHWSRTASYPDADNIAY